MRLELCVCGFVFVGPGPLFLRVAVSERVRRELEIVRFWGWR
jgi:hypothetical protein